MGLALRNHPGPYFVTKTNPGAFGAGHLNLAIVEQITARRLVDGQVVRLYNLNATRGGTSAFRINLYHRGDAYQLEYQVVRHFVRSEWINRVDHYCDLGHDRSQSEWAGYYQPGRRIFREWVELATFPAIKNTIFVARGGL